MLDNNDDGDEKTEDTDGEIPEQELLLLRQQILSMSRESKDAVVKLLQLPKRQQMLLLSAVKLDESGRIRASNDGRNTGPSSSAGYPADVGAGNPPKADVGAGYPPNVGAGYPPNVGAGYPPNVGAGYRPKADVGAGYRPNVGAGYPPNVGTGNPPRRAGVEVILPPELDIKDGRDLEVVAELGRIAEAGGQDPLQMDLPFRVDRTVEFNLFGTGNRWFYLLKCNGCNRMAVTKSGNGDGPVHWARKAGWSRPECGRQKWKRCWCPCHPGGH